MPASRSPAKRWTLAEVYALDDPILHTPRHELVDGELLVTPSPIPAHQRAVFIFARLLDDYARTHKEG